MTKVFLNLLKLFLPFRMQVCLMRLTPQGILALYDRARKRKIIVFHLALVGQAVYINPIINEMILRREKISIYLVLDKDLDATKDHLSQLTGISSSKIGLPSDAGTCSSKSTVTSVPLLDTASNIFLQRSSISSIFGLELLPPTL